MKRIMIDADKCDGCKNCSIACMNANREDKGTIYDLDVTCGKNLSRNFIYQIGDKYYPVFCRHCDDPDCVGACMSNALTKNPDTGYIEYDKTRCAACYMCVMSCRYGLLRPDMNRKSMVGCSFCQDTEDKEPECVKACPKKAIYIEEVPS